MTAPLYFIPLIFLLVALDQLTKLLVLYAVPLYGTLKIIPGFFYLTHLYNTGAAFGIMHDSNRFFMGISLAALVILFWQRHRFVSLALQLGWVLILSGILGNLCDRLWRGHVVDFLGFQIWNYYWPPFNVADTCICMATGFFFLSAFSSQRAR
ncbi:MAG: signal peptidase II [Chthoniobacterales bacterium]